MTHKEKADELISVVYKELDENQCYCTISGEIDYEGTKGAAKELAKLFVKEITNVVYGTDADGSQHDWWQQVKEEL